MGKTALLVLVAAITMIKCVLNSKCTRQGGYCSESDTCTSLGGHVEKLCAMCKCGKACCKCTDTCPDGSTCMSEGETCDGKKEKSDCCGNRFCCTPPTTTQCVINCDGNCMEDCSATHLESIGECCGWKCCT
ncbi:keratin-associated protein 5-8-like [Mytilus californianus]|uniref:keratin-associated protein 5-8-like n=1 Tax=Mytilus californianus TaxID=6549 RepID=UPI002245EA88|nr:keratin-associated protein 5-8-like [Mytilus californianus]XP_052078883.1 keratin-associated protein 5-8-like [Mytilus californianus]